MGKRNSTHLPAKKRRLQKCLNKKTHLRYRLMLQRIKTKSKIIKKIPTHGNTKNWDISSETKHLPKFTTGILYLLPTNKKTQHQKTYSSAVTASKSSGGRTTVTVTTAVTPSANFSVTSLVPISLMCSDSFTTESATSKPCSRKLHAI